MKQLIGGFVFEQHGECLTCRKSWWWFVGGCALALLSVAAGTAVTAHWLSDRNVYVGGGRSTPGRPVAPADQTTVQRMRYYGVLTLLAGPLFLVPVAYAIFGSGDQRNPLRLDRTADRVSRGRDVLCKASAIVAVRLVETRKPAARRGPTGVFARLHAAPWSIELGGFGRFATAERFAARISTFLGVRMYDDPLFPPGDRRPAFPVIVPAGDGRAGPPARDTGPSAPGPRG